MTGSEQDNASHPYNSYEGGSEWIIIEKLISDLAQNKDILITTRKEYVVGYLVEGIKRLRKDSST